MTPTDIAMKKFNNAKDVFVKEVAEYVCWHFKLMNFGHPDNFISLPNDLLTAIQQEPAIEAKLLDKLAEKCLTFVVLSGKGVILRYHETSKMFNGNLYLLSAEIGIPEIKERFDINIKPLAIKLKGDELERVKSSEERFGARAVNDEFRRFHFQLHKSSNGEYFVSKLGIRVTECL